MECILKAKKKKKKAQEAHDRAKLKWKMVMEKKVLQKETMKAYKWPKKINTQLKKEKQAIMSRMKATKSKNIKN